MTRPATRNREGGEWAPHGARPAADLLSRSLEERGLLPVPYPLLRIVPPEDPEPLRAAAAQLLTLSARNLQSGDAAGATDPARAVWLVLTSANAVAPFLKALKHAGGEPRDLADAGVMVAAVGRATARALERMGLSVAVVPERFTAEGLAEAMGRHRVERGGTIPTDVEGPARPMSGHRVVFPRADRARDVLPRRLEELGARVVSAIAYRVVVNPPGARRLASVVARGELDAVTLTSGAAARTLADGWYAEQGGAPWPRSVLVAAIGPVTAAAAREARLPVDVTPEETSLAALARVVSDRLVG